MAKEKRDAHALLGIRLEIGQAANHEVAIGARLESRDARDAERRVQRIARGRAHRGGDRAEPGRLRALEAEGVRPRDGALLHAERRAEAQIAAEEVEPAAQPRVVALPVVLPRIRVAPRERHVVAAPSAVSADLVAHILDAPRRLADDVHRGRRDDVHEVVCAELDTFFHDSINFDEARRDRRRVAVLIEARAGARPDAGRLLSAAIRAHGGERDQTHDTPRRACAQLQPHPAPSASSKPPLAPSRES